MNKLAVLLTLAFVSGCSCSFDTGSNSFAKAMGKSISLECFKSNLKSIEGLEIGEETSNSIILVGPGINSTIEFKSINSVVSSYSISTKTEKSKDSGIHKTVESAINLPCDS